MMIERYTVYVFVGAFEFVFISDSFTSCSVPARPTIPENLDRGGRPVAPGDVPAGFRAKRGLLSPGEGEGSGLVFKYR